MCFSAFAGFAASAVLTVAGALALRLVRRHGQRSFAIIPWICAVQQFIEGWLWLGLQGDTAARSYLVFAQMLWPIWVPSAMLGMDQIALIPPSTPMT